MINQIIIITNSHKLNNISTTKISTILINNLSETKLTAQNIPFIQLRRKNYQKLMSTSSNCKWSLITFKIVSTCSWTIPVRQNNIHKKIITDSVTIPKAKLIKTISNLNFYSTWMTFSNKSFLKEHEDNSSLFYHKIS